MRELGTVPDSRVDKAFRDLGVAGGSAGFLRPAWAEIDLSRLRKNFLRLRRIVGPAVKILFVVKADAYGHGAARLARAAELFKGNDRSTPFLDWLGVSSVEEGVALREAGVKTPILILGSLYPFQSFVAAARRRLVPTVASLEAARRLSETALKIGERIACHLKVDTGMGRIGLSPRSAPRAMDYILSRSHLRLEGVYTHFASAESDPAFTRLQMRRFNEALASMRGKNGRIMRHAANSAAAVRYPAARLDMVRSGLALYGLYPGFDPVLSLKSRVVFLKSIEKNVPISYGKTFRARRASRIATLSIGYGDGVPRALSNRGRVLLEGRPCPIVGAVTMDMTMVDVTDVPSVRVGSEAVLVGAQGRHSIPMSDVAETAGTIPYEIACGLARRVPRIYRS